MNTTRAFAISLHVLLASLPSIHAQTPATPGAPAAPPTVEAKNEGARAKAELEAKWQVQVDAQFVALNEQTALELVPELQAADEKRAEAAWSRIQELIRLKQAKLLGWPMITTLSGARAVVELIEEKRYPTEFGDPSSATSPSGAAGAIAPNPLVGAIDAELAIPTAFETRNIGITLEVEPRVLDDGRNVLLNLVPQRVILLGFDSFDGGKAKNGKVLKIEQPQFATSKSTTILTVRSGRRMLLSFNKVPKSEDTVELVILRATALPTH